MAKHTAVLAAVVAAVSLAISAWGTYKSAQVADDQLAESREKDKAEERAQASRISMWGEPQNVVFANRSLDAVSISLIFYGRTAIPMPLGEIPPCKAVYMKRSDLEPYVVTWSKITKRPIPKVQQVALAFRDAAGLAWIRTSSGKLMRIHDYGVSPTLRNPFTSEGSLSLGTFRNLTDCSTGN
ncbi:hypothetical protein [Streptomyces xantholiticus]|uniref:Secreted protein n=1 Tax=Streptomyces xantholiticus TaxID=68285 RepID=A0ABV1V0V6_9ACTN